MTAEQKAWIDNASLEELLRRWFRAPRLDPPFSSGETVKYCSDRTARLRDEDWHGWVAASKRIWREERQGWTKERRTA